MSGFHWVPIDLTGSIGGLIILGLIALMILVEIYVVYSGWKDSQWIKKNRGE